MYTVAIIYRINVVSSIYNFLTIPDPQPFTRPRTLSVIPQHILRQMKPLKKFIRLKLLTSKQQKHLENMLDKAEKRIQHSIITNAKEQFDVFVKSKYKLQKSLRIYLKDHGNYHTFILLFKTRKHNISQNPCFSVNFIFKFDNSPSPDTENVPSPDTENVPSPDNVLLQTERLEKFMQMKEQNNDLREILCSEQQSIKDTIIKYLRCKTNAEDTFDAFTSACEKPLEGMIHNYRKKPPVNGNIRTCLSLLYWFTIFHLTAEHSTVCDITQSMT